MKVLSPIVAVFYKEMDFKAVKYIVKKSIKHILIVSIPISVLFFVYPEILIKLFNITNPQHIQLACFAIRITSFGLIGRCMSYLLANYAQAIEQNRISFTITFCEEFLISIVAALILTHFIGGVGIWIAILLSETIPLLIYIVMAKYLQRSREIKNLFLLKDSKLVNFTYVKGHNEYSDDLLEKIETIFKEYAPLFF
jgi:Na+-driven multidrug efflux pump